jgi:sucrose-6-phosphate hydrolase SacC (GH32 family)
MIISAWEDGVPRDVNYAVGVYDGRAFTARRYGRLTHGAELYATTTFRDVAGRPCAMSWLRERNNVAPEGSPWCSAMSLPHVLSIKNGELTVAQHPNLELALAKTYPLADTPSGGKLDIAVPGPVWRLRFRAACDQPGSFSVIVTGDGQSFAVNAAGDSLAVADADGTTLLTMPLSPTHAHDVDVVVDADILELTVTGTEGIAATRIPVTGAGHIRISTDKGCSLTDATLSTPRRN